MPLDSACVHDWKVCIAHMISCAGMNAVFNLSCLVGNKQKIYYFNILSSTAEFLWNNTEAISACMQKRKFSSLACVKCERGV